MELDRSSDVLEIDRPNKPRKIIPMEPDRSSDVLEIDRPNKLRKIIQIVPRFGLRPVAPIIPER